MNPVSKLKNTKNGVFALITNGVGGNLSKFTDLVASIVVNALILPAIYYFCKLIKARQEGSKRVCFENERYDNIVELVKASQNIWDENGRLIIDPRKEKGVVAGKASIYRLTGVIGSIISLAFSILSLYSFISSWRFKNQMNARDISFALLSPLVAAVTIFLQGKLVGDRLREFIKEIGIGRLTSTIRDVNYYAKSEPMIYYEKGIATNYYDNQVTEEPIRLEKPYYYSFVCALSLSFAAFAQSIAVYKLPNTMRISAFVVCANLCFAFSKLIFDAYYTYRCNIYDKKNRVVVIGETIIDPGNAQPRELLQIRLAGKVGELREALKTKLDEVIKILKQKVKNRPKATTSIRRLVERATLLNLALDSLNEPVNLGLAENIADNTEIAMNIMHNAALGVGNHKRAIYSTRFNGSDPALLKADRTDLTQQLKEGAYIHRFKDDKVKMEDQHICYGLEEAGLMMGGALDVCHVHNKIGPHSKQKITTTSFELVILALVARQSEIAGGCGENAILKTIRKVAKEAEEEEEVVDPLTTFRISSESFLKEVKDIENAFDFKVKQMATAGA